MPNKDIEWENAKIMCKPSILIKSVTNQFLAISC